MATKSQNPFDLQGLKLPGIDVPAEVRELADKSVEQARTAVNGFMGAAHKAVDQMHGSAESARVNAQETSKKALGYAEQNLSAAFDLAQKMMRAKDPMELMTLQAEFAKAQLAQFQQQITEVSQVAQKAASATAQEMQKAASAMVQDMTSSAKKG